MTFRTRRAPSDLSPREAQRALSGLLPLIEELARAAYPDEEGSDGSTGEDRLDKVARQANPVVADVLRAYPPDGSNG